MRQALGALARGAARLGAGEVEVASEHEAVPVTAVVHSTTDVEPGALFCCVKGSRVDGHDLAPEAVERGAVALLVERTLDASQVDGTVAQLVVADVRRAMGPFAAAFWGEPSRKLDVVGVTGTAGKTTTVELVRAVLSAAGRQCGTIGTLSGPRTTPEAPELQAQLADELRQGSDAVSMEVSSHGLDLHRVDGTWFAVTVFTNLSHDHLDFHETMERYFAAKARLFTAGFTDHAVVCTDDPWGRRLLDALAVDPSIRIHPYSVADATDLELSPRGARFTWRGHQVEIALTGRFNVANALAAATVGDVLGLPREAVVAGLAEARPAAGRFEQVEAGQQFTVLVDYAHKPDALEQALVAARELTGREPEGGRLTVVFGCGGDRDRGKRPLMGEVAGRLADRVVLTSDNPRSEDPAGIVAEVSAGVGPEVAVEVELDRRRALTVALGQARGDDVVVIAGKGHEATQNFGHEVVPFDDRVVAREILSAMTGDETT
jgi:UDP-N-acetylmuramoyl-L-alanyl-D-glutamate--2,6-diaminopimelate ligase